MKKAKEKNYDDSRPPAIVPPDHPLDPLTPEEIELTVKICRMVRPTAKFVTICVREPSKATVLKWKPGDMLERKAFVVLHLPQEEKTYETVVNLTLNEIGNLNLMRGVQPRLMPHEYFEVEKMCREDPRMIEELKRRGITDPSGVKADIWGVGYFTEEDDCSRRLGRPLLYYKRDEDSEEYNCPIEGLCPLVDLNKMEILHIDNYSVLPLPPVASKYKTKYKESKIPQVKPLKVIQPKGTSFKLEGYRLTWQNWSMRIGFSPREGVILHQVTIFDSEENTYRPIIHRASLNEMVVPYGDPQPPHYRKNAFDVGEDGIGVNLSPQRSGCDCLGEAAFVDVHMADGDGEVVTIRDAVCIHEEDAGILWRHTDFRTGKTDMRRSRRLVISSFTTVANYDYGLYWYFYPDGTIEFEALLTGILSTKVIAGGESKHGDTVGPQIAGTNHQHFFCFKLDMMVDGPNNSVYEVNTVTNHPSNVNIHKNAFLTQKTLIRSEMEGGREVNQLNGRCWVIVNPTKLNKYDQMVGYKLVPGENVLPMVHPEALILKRAPFLKKHLWVTQYDKSLEYAAGNYPNQAKEEKGGITEWITGNRPLDNEDIVVWYNFGHHHVTRPEEWPIMSGVRSGFKLKPQGFFNENPAIYVAPPPCSVDDDEPTPLVSKL